MTFEELRISCQCPETLARRLFNDCTELRAQLATTQAAHALEQALRIKAENKLAKAMPRRINRDREED